MAGKDALRRSSIVLLDKWDQFLPHKIEEPVAAPHFSRPDLPVLVSVLMQTGWCQIAIPQTVTIRNGDDNQIRDGIRAVQDMDAAVVAIELFVDVDIIK